MIYTAVQTAIRQPFVTRAAMAWRQDGMSSSNAGNWESGDLADGGLRILALDSGHPSSRRRELLADCISGSVGMPSSTLDEELITCLANENPSAYWEKRLVGGLGGSAVIDLLKPELQGCKLRASVPRCSFPTAALICCTQVRN